MKIYGINYGGFGNAVFNVLGTILLKVLFPDLELVSFETMEEIETYKQTAIKMDDEYFLEIINAKIERYTDILDPSQHYWLSAYCQYDEIYVRYQKQIVEYILAHPQEKIFAGHTYRFFPIHDIVSVQETESYDVLLHLRLGDFVALGWVIHPESIRQAFTKALADTLADALADASSNDLADTLADALSNDRNKKIGIMVDHRNTELEKKYVEYIREICPAAEILENNDIITDYNLLKNAKHVIASCSTFSWIAVLFAQENQTVSFPNYEHRWQHEQFRRTHDRFTYYEFSRISEENLRAFLFSHFSKYVEK
jgi:hypothetical protein